MTYSKRKNSVRRFILIAIIFGTSMIALRSHCAPGDLYETDLGSGTVFKFAPNGTKTVVATGFNTPVGIACDGKGNLFISTPGAGTVFKIAPDGMQTVFAAVPDGPTGLAFDSSGNLFIGVFNTGLVLKVTPDGTQSTFASGLMNTTGLAFDKDGNLFAADLGAGTISKITPSGIKTTFALGLASPGGIAFDKSGNLFAGSNSDGLIYKFAPDGTKTTFASEVDGAAGLAFDGAGNLFVASNVSGGAIFRFTPSGAKTTFASGLNMATFLAFEPSPQKLLNASARALVQTGDNVLIVGFVVGGSALSNNPILVRAIGPSLSQSGVTNPLPDPKLELYDRSGTVIASNDNWQDTQKAGITASGLAPSNTHESVIMMHLPAGEYTAIVRSGDGMTGNALAEIFNLQ